MRANLDSVLARNSITKPLIAQQRETTTVDAAALRHEGEQAFLIYTGAPAGPSTRCR